MDDPRMLMRRASASAPKGAIPDPTKTTPTERICAALELGRRGRALNQLVKHGRVRGAAEPRPR